MLALVAHFVPCAWWTCDWGPGDEEGVRGAIWFGGTAVLTIILCFIRPKGLRVSGSQQEEWVAGVSRYGKESGENAEDPTSPLQQNLSP